MSKMTNLLTVLKFSVLLAGNLGTATASLSAQEYQGVVFEDDLDWHGVLAKAKALNKHIFVDFYTTWCAPCKHIDKNVFPTAEAGEYFNQRFVNLKIQLDKTSKDSERIKRWYVQADSLGKVFQIQTLPTFIILDPSGEPLHRVSGGGDSIHLFIGRINEAFDPEKQYYTRVKNTTVEAVNDLKDFKRLAIQSKTASHGANAKMFADLYLEGLKGNYSKEDLEFAKEFNEHEKGAAFRIFLQEAGKVNKIMGKGFAEREAISIIQKVEFYGSGVSNDSLVDWKAMKKRLSARYGKMSRQALKKFRLDHALQLKNSDEFLKRIPGYLKKYINETDHGELNYYALMTMRYTDSRKVLEKAIAWSETAMSRHTDYTMEDVYAQLLYKMGRTEEAIQLAEKVLEQAHSHRKHYFQKHLDTMKAGEKLWPVDLKD